MGLLFIIIAVILNLNGATWFEGEDGVQTALYWIGGILIVAQIVLTLVFGSLVALASGSASKRSRRF